jgi:hypothetical protein
MARPHVLPEGPQRRHVGELLVPVEGDPVVAARLPIEHLPDPAEPVEIEPVVAADLDLEPSEAVFPDGSIESRRQSVRRQGAGAFACFQRIAEPNGMADAQARQRPLRQELVRLLTGQRGMEIPEADPKRVLPYCLRERNVLGATERVDRSALHERDAEGGEDRCHLGSARSLLRMHLMPEIEDRPGASTFDGNGGRALDHADHLFDVVAV